MAPRRLRLALVCCCAVVLSAEPVRVRHLEGLQHGFLVLRSEDGKIVANGELSQEVRADRVTSHLVYRFRDGSLQEETTVYTQHRDFHLVSDHLIQRGPAFQRALDLKTVPATGEITVNYEDGKGKTRTETSKVELPPDLSNGMVSTLLKNIPAQGSLSLSMVVASPKPRIVKLDITPEGANSFSTGGMRHRASRYRVKIKLGGVAGAVAPLIGKQPPDTLVWILPGAAPAFLKSEGPLHEGGPILRIELISPSWLPTKRSQ